MRIVLMVAGLVLTACSEPDDSSGTTVQVAGLELREVWIDCDEPADGWPAEVEMPSATTWQVELYDDGLWLDYPGAVERVGDGVRAVLVLEDCHGYPSAVVRWWE